jgi:hypothetical protein
MIARVLARAVGTVCGWLVLAYFTAAMLYDPRRCGVVEALIIGAVVATLVVGFLFATVYWDHRS